MEPKIAISGLNKDFWSDRQSVCALQDIDLTIADGEFVCIVGPSGCGKTTLLRIVAGLEAASSGTVTIQHDSASRPLNSMVFQEQSVFPWMTVRDNIAFGLRCRGVDRRTRERDSRPLHSRGRPEGIRWCISAPALGRHEAAGFAGACFCERSRGPSYGRAVRRPRRADQDHLAGVAD